jgi:hypothetical protein
VEYPDAFLWVLGAETYVSGKTIHDVHEVQKGTKLFIMKRPGRWSSRLNRECPFDYEIEYPHQIEVKSVIHGDRLQHHNPITCGNYGWDLNSIMDDGARIAHKLEFKKIK